MTVFILPTKGATKYRGKYPTRARSIGGYASRGTGRHIELNDGTRLWSADDRTPEFSAGSLNDDYAAIKAGAVQMTDEQYEVLKRGAEKAREVVGLCGHTARAQVERQARAIVESIVPAPMKRRERMDVEAAARRDSADYQEGKEAAARGEPLQACPYTWGGIKAHTWALGWKEGDKPAAAATRLRVVRNADGGQSLIPATVDPRARVAARLAPAQEARKAPATHFATWSELTDAEQREARFRGFPMEAIFTVKRRYADGEMMLVHWQKGQPIRNAHGIITGVE